MTSKVPGMRPGDIVIVHGRGLFSRLIRRFSSPAERVTATHVALAVSPVAVVEALPEGVVIRPYSSGHVWSAVNLSPLERQRIAACALEYVGRPYGWGKIALHALGLEQFAAMDGFPICSWVVAAAYAREGYTFGVDHRRATPDDIEDFVRGRPDKFRRVL